MEDLIREKVTQKENELNATYDEKMMNYEERWVTRILRRLDTDDSLPANVAYSGK
jgi:hypothetical protein